MMDLDAELHPGLLEYVADTCPLVEQTLAVQPHDIHDADFDTSLLTIPYGVPVQVNQDYTNLEQPNLTFDVAFEPSAHHGQGDINGKHLLATFNTYNSKPDHFFAQPGQDVFEVDLPDLPLDSPSDPSSEASRVQLNQLACDPLPLSDDDFSRLLDTIAAAEGGAQYDWSFPEIIADQQILDPPPECLLSISATATETPQQPSPRTVEPEDTSLSRQGFWVNQEGEEQTEEAEPKIYDSIQPEQVSNIEVTGNADHRETPPEDKTKQKFRNSVFPMKSLFKSMHVSRENFLPLQGAAKIYMLDRKFPGRLASVMHRANDPSNNAQLRLLRCAQIFLKEEGWGEKCWGVKSLNTELSWPSDEESITCAIIQLFRRVVKNERQRLYVWGKRTKKVDSSDDGGLRNRKTAVVESSSQVVIGQSPIIMTGPFTPFSPLASCNGFDNDSELSSVVLDGPFTITQSKMQISTNTTRTYLPGAKLTAYSINPENKQLNSIELRGVATLKLNINVMSTSRRILPKLELTTLTCPTFAFLLASIHEVLDAKHYYSKIQALTSNGLVVVEDEKQWQTVLDIVKACDWMDEELRVIVELIT